jgi:hypothetical protein
MGQRRRPRPPSGQGPARRRPVATIAPEPVASAEVAAVVERVHRAGAAVGGPASGLAARGRASARRAAPTGRPFDLLLSIGQGLHWARSRRPVAWIATSSPRPFACWSPVVSSETKNCRPARPAPQSPNRLPPRSRRRNRTAFDRDGRRQVARCVSHCIAHRAGGRSIAGSNPVSAIEGNPCEPAVFSPTIGPARCVLADNWGTIFFGTCKRAASAGVCGGVARG